MHVVCLLSLKGGAGKSTVVQSLAVCAQQHGQKTMIIELDPQGTLKDWSKRRIQYAETANDPFLKSPPVLQTLPQSIEEHLNQARVNGTNWVFLDTPGSDASTAAAAAAHADVILIPCKIQSAKDQDALMLSVNEAKRAKAPAYVVMNQVPPNAEKLVRRRQVALQHHHNVTVLSRYLSRRADFEYGDANGLAVTEYQREGAAAQEVERLFALLQSIFMMRHPQAETPLLEHRPGYAKAVDVTMPSEEAWNTQIEDADDDGLDDIVVPMPRQGTGKYR